MSLTKAQLQGLNTTNFPNNTTGYITPALLREFNSESVDSMALQTQVDSLSSSFQSQLNDLEDFSSSLVTNFATVAQLNTSSSVLQSNINGKATTGSVNTLSQSVYVGFSDQATINSNTINRFNADELAFNQYTQSNNTAVAGKASLSQDNYFVGNQYVTGKVSVTGNISASGDIRAEGNVYGANLTGSFVSSSTFNSFTASYVTFSGSQYKNDSSSFDSRILAITSSGGNVSVQEEGSILGNATSFNFIGAGVTATFSAGTASVTIPGGGGSVDTGSFITTGSITNSQTISGNLTVSRSAASGQNAINAIGNVNITDTLTVSSLTISGSSEDGAINMMYPSTLVQSAGNITFRNYLNSPSPSYTGSITLTTTSGSGITLNANGGANIKVNADIIQTGSLFVNGNIYAANLTGSGEGGTGGATTGSNSFTGSQTINGNIILTGSNAEIQNAKGVGIYNSLYNLDYSLSMPIQNTIGYIDDLGLPHYYNGGVQPTISASATINNHHLVKVTPQQWFNLTASVGDNHFGILSVEQSTGWADINNTFGLHGNALSSGSVNYITQRGLSKVGIFKLGGSPVEPYIGQPVYVSDNGYELQAGYPSGSRVLRYGYVASFEQSDPMNMYVRQIYVDPVWEKGETITDLNVSSSLRITGSLNVTGSTYFSELTSSLETYSASVSSRINAITSSATIDTGSFATTGSNYFKGQQTLTDADLLNQITLDDYSGSLVLFGKGFTSSSLTHITASSTAVDSIIFKTNNNTAATLLSGSANLFVNPTAPTAGFTRLVGSAGNIELNASNVPQISSSMAFPITMNNNYFGGNSTTLTMRGPVSASGWTISGNSILGTVNIGSSAALHAERINSLTMTGNQIAGTVTITANSSSLAQPFNITNNNINGGFTITAISSSLAAANNNINDSAFTITNNFFSGSLGTGQLAFNRNNIGGQSNQLITQGGTPAGGTGAPSISDNTILGGNNTLFVDVANAALTGSAPYFSAVRNIIGGHNLIVSASSTLNHSQTFGSAFFGRWNAQDGNKSKTAQTVFAVGTGTSTTNRKTGFLIDSGSNTFVEGTLNVSGSTSTTGSITIQSGSGDLFVHGHKQFNVGAFTSTITQSGSANVSQSMTFNVTDVSQGVTLNGGTTQLTLTNAGTYNIQFSAQILADTGADDVRIWLKKNGTNVDNSAGRVTLANNEELMAAWNYVVDANAGDYYELVWESTGGDALLLYNAPSGNYPAVPSVIATVTQVR